MSLVERLGMGWLQIGLCVLLSNPEIFFNRFSQPGLVALDVKQVVALARDHLRGNCRLASHRIDRHNATSQSQIGQQGFDRRYLIGFLFTALLA